MCRAALALALSCSIASVALARDLCIQVNNGSLAGSQLVLKKAKLGRRNVGQVQGHLARYSQFAPLPGFFEFTPIYGQSVVNGNGDVAMAITIHNVGTLSPNGLTNGPGASPFNVTCSTAGDGSLDEVDPCSGFLNNESMQGLIVGCEDVVAVQ